MSFLHSSIRPVDDRERRPTLRELEALHALIEARKTTSAASMLGISQPAISRAIQQLEGRIGKVLFRREGGRLVATPEGLALYQETQQIFRTLDRLGGVSSQKGQDVLLRLIAPPTISYMFLPKLLATFFKSEPNVQMIVESGTTSDVIAKTADGSFDIGISDAQPAVPTVQFEPFRRAHAHCFLPREHPLATRDFVTPKDLESVPYIALARRFTVRAIMDTLFAEAGVKPQIIVEASTSGIAYELVRSGVGFALMNPFPMSFGLSPDVALVPFKPVVPFETVFVFPVGAPLPSHARRFVDFVRRNQDADGYSTPIA